MTNNEGHIKHKRGALSAEEMKFIRDHVTDMEPALIAAHLNRTTEPIIRFISRNRVGQTFEEIKGEAEKSERQIYHGLKQKSFYKNLKEQLSVQELDYFADHWVSLIMQFNGDLAASEEMELKELLILEILKNRETTAEYNRRVVTDNLQAQIREEMKKKTGRDKELIMELRRQITDIQMASNAYIKNFKDLCDRAEKMRKALNASRHDRVKNIENAKIDFVAFLKLLEEHGEKIRVGREMEIIRQAKMKEARRLSQMHSYSDGKVDRPLLNEDTVDYDDNHEGPSGDHTST